MRVNMNVVKAFILKRKNTTYNVNSFLCDSTSVWGGGVVLDERYATFTLLEDDTYSIKGIVVKLERMPNDIIIPSEYNGKPVTVIEEQAFVYVYIAPDFSSMTTICSNFRSVTIPSTITTIGNFAFAGNNKLSEVIFDEGSQLTSIGDDAFGECNLKTFTIPESVTTIGSFAFEKNEFEEVIIPDGVTTIESQAFSHCYNLKRAFIPSSVITMDGSIFNGSSNVTIYCEVESQPEGWDNLWNRNLSNDSYLPVVWGYTG